MKRNAEDCIQNIFQELIRIKTIKKFLVDFDICIFTTIKALNDKLMILISCSHINVLLKILIFFQHGVRAVTCSFLVANNFSRFSLLYLTFFQMQYFLCSCKKLPFQRSLKTKQSTNSISSLLSPIQASISSMA